MIMDLKQVINMMIWPTKRSYAHLAKTTTTDDTT